MLTNFFVPDGVTYLELSKEISAEGIQNLFETSIKNDLGLPVNLFVVAYSILPYKSIFSYFLLNLLFFYLIFGSKLKLSKIFLFPYFIISMLLPSKDLFVMFSCFAFFQAVKIKNIMLICISILLLIISREVMAPLLLLCLFLSTPTITKSKKIALLSGVVILAFFCKNQVINLIDSSFTMTKGIASRDFAAKIIFDNYFIQYFVTLIGNIFNAGLRPGIFTIDKNISIVGLSMAISGISQIYAFVIAMHKVVKTKTFDIYDISLFCSAIISGFYPFISSRFLSPISFCYLYSKKKLNKIVYLLLLIVVCIFYLICFSFGDRILFSAEQSNFKF